MTGVQPGVGRVVALLAALAVVVLAASPAAAHATLVSTSPADGAVLEELPGSVDLTFSESMTSPAYVTVTAPDGTDVAAGRPAVTGPVVSQALDSTDLSGTYVLAFRAVSRDGHPLTGQLSFHVGEPGGVATEAPGPGGTTPTTARESGTTARQVAGRAGWDRRATDLLVAGALFGVAGLLWFGSRRTRQA